MYESFYGLRERPFSVQPDPEYAYQSKEHQIAIANIVYAADYRLGLALLTGPVGVGKTTVGNLMQAAWASDTGKTVAFVPDPSPRTRPAFLRLVLQAFGLETARYGGDNQRTLERFLISEYDAGRHPILLIDEGQKLSAENIDTIADLTNFQTAKSKLITFIILAQDNFSNKTKGKTAFRSRIAVPGTMDALTFPDTQAMLTHRLTTAGGGPVEQYFTPDAVHSIYRITRGIPRDICVLCDGAMVRGFVESEKLITEQTVTMVAQSMGKDKDWNLEGPAPPEKPKRTRAPRKKVE